MRFSDFGRVITEVVSGTHVSEKDEKHRAGPDRLCDEAHSQLSLA